MATIRERRPGVWEVRVFTAPDARGRPTQMSRTMRSGKREAQRLAAQLESSDGKAKPAGRSVGDVLDEWVKQNIDTWAPSSARDQQSRVSAIKKDQIASLPLARRTVVAIGQGHDVRTVAGRLRHAKPEMTLRVYAHAFAAADEAVAAGLGGILKGDGK